MCQCHDQIELEGGRIELAMCQCHDQIELEGGQIDIAMCQCHDQTGGGSDRTCDVSVT